MRPSRDLYTLSRPSVRARSGSLSFDNSYAELAGGWSKRDALDEFDTWLRR